MKLIRYDIVFTTALFFGMIVLLEVGRRIGVRRLIQDPGAQKGVSTIEGSMFGLLGLLIAFTFSDAASRFDMRRQLIVGEANDIGTAYLRIDLLPDDAQPAMRELFRQYLNSRLATYRKLPDIPAAEAELAHSQKLQNIIWKQSVAICEIKKDPATTSLVLSALNTMFDITSTRTFSMQMHPPIIIFAMLGVLAWVSSLLAGHSMANRKTRSRIHTFGFAVIVAITVYVIIDIEYPRFGFIRVDKFDEALQQVQQSMK